MIPAFHMLSLRYNGHLTPTWPLGYGKPLPFFIMWLIRDNFSNISVKVLSIYLQQHSNRYGPFSVKTGLNDIT